nr:hypothetical protein [Tanacetum cinerariifolium]
MATTIDQQVALDESLVPSTQRLRIGRSNFRLPLDIQSKESTLQVVYDVLWNSPLFRAFQVTADVPEIYMQEFWATAKLHHNSIRFKIDTKKSVLDLEAFREMLHISPRIPNQFFADLPTEEEILEFLRFLGHSHDIRYLTDVNVNKLYQPWRSFASVINKCLTGKSSGVDKIMSIVRGGKQRGHIPGVGRVLPGQRTVIPPPSQGTHLADIDRPKKREKLLTKQGLALALPFLAPNSTGAEGGVVAKIGLAFWNDPKNLARAAQNKQNRAKSKVVCRQGSRSIAAFRDMHMETSATREYPSLIYTFFMTHTVGDVFLNPENKALYDPTPPRVCPTQRMRSWPLFAGASRRGHIPGVGRVLPGQRTVIPPPSQGTQLADIDRLKKRERLLTKQVNMFMRLFRSDDKFSQMLTQFESQPEYGGGSGSDGFGDDELGDDEDGGEDEEEEDDS